jgi:hypothetical protein
MALLHSFAHAAALRIAGAASVSATTVGDVDSM